jgi:hypothetical protein
MCRFFRLHKFHLRSWIWEQLCSIFFMLSLNIFFWYLWSGKLCVLNTWWGELLHGNWNRSGEIFGLTQILFNFYQYFSSLLHFVSNWEAKKIQTCSREWIQLNYSSFLISGESKRLQKIKKFVSKKSSSKSQQQNRETAKVKRKSPRNETSFKFTAIKLETIRLTNWQTKNDKNMRKILKQKN